MHLSSDVVSHDSIGETRRQAVWLAPIIVVAHGVLIQGLVPGHLAFHAALAVVACLAGLTLRWTRRASVVVGAKIAMTGLFLVYMFGIAAPLSYLAHAGYRRLLPVTFFSISVGFGAFLIWRTRVSLLQEWSQALERCPGLSVGSEGTITCKPVSRRQPIVTAIACVLIALLIPALYFARDTAAYLPLAMSLGPACIAPLAIDPLAYLIAFYISIRRWERAHGTPLRFPPLRSRRPR
jgi:hypothetical protein